MEVDIEILLDKIDTFLKANLNLQIASINLEKNDTLALATVSDDAYFFQTMNDRVANFDPFLFYGLDNVDSEGIGPATRKTYSIQVIIVVTDTGQDELMGKRLLRYSRVLEDLFNNYWASIKSSVNFKVQSLVPVAFSLVNSSDVYRAVGITLTTSLG
jgi:hypothetical protein